MRSVLLEVIASPDKSRGICRAEMRLKIRVFLKVVLKYSILSFVSTSFSTQPQPFFVYLQSSAGSNNKQDKTKSCKHQSP